jgi:hypothetical protein
MNLTLEAGLVMRKSVRNYLDQFEFTYKDIEWKEFKSTLSSTFVIRGDVNALVRIKNDIEEFNK